MYSNLLIFPDKSARLSRVVWDASTPVTKAHLDLEPSAVVVADAGRCWRRAAMASNPILQNGAFVQTRWYR
jgi:hypothetical protein